MKIDSLGNVIYQTQDLIELIYQEKFEFLDQVMIEDARDISKFEEHSHIPLKKVNQKTYENVSLEDFDKLCQSDWFMPEEYKVMDIEGYLVHVCPKENYQRLIEELQEFRARNMLDVLRVLKYLVDTLRKNNIVWGVGRGSSVASYTLFLLGVHKIDSIKYNLDWHEFLR